MIKNGKFVIPTPPPSNPTDQPYYIKSSYDNSWNMPQLSSPKISQFYHSINQSFLSSQNSPSQKLLMQKSYEDKQRILKITSHKASAKKRLNARKLERTELEKYCKNSSGSPMPMLTQIIQASQSNTPHCPSPWDQIKYENLPKTAQKKILTNKIASIQLSSFYNIINKTQELMKFEEWKKEKVKLESLEQREKLRKKNEGKRMKESVEKIRVVEGEDAETFCESSFGYYKRHKTGKLFERLSKPKEKIEYSVKKSDLRDLLIGQNIVCKDRVCNRMGNRRSSM